jgi:lantibiotic leader peptide-processing serine protease
MTVPIRWRWVVVGTAVAMVAGAFAGGASAGAAGASATRSSARHISAQVTPHASPGRYIVQVRSRSDASAVRTLAARLGGQVVLKIRPIGAFVVVSSPAVRAALARDSRVLAIGEDGVRGINDGSSLTSANFSAPGLQSAVRVSLAGAPRTPNDVVGDPSYSYSGLMWDEDRIGVQDAWQVTTGDPSVIVGVSDTGLDFTQADIAPNVVAVHDFTTTENPPICKTFFGTSDRQLAMATGGPVKTDWFGHGSWIGGNIAGAMDGSGMNGIAPGVKLASLKIAQWCGYAYDSTILRSFAFAASHHYDIVSISFGGYADRSIPAQNNTWNMYREIVAMAKTKGTVIVAAGGNEHTQIGTDGQVVSHGSLTTPGAAPVDYFGKYETPGGIPGVIDVSSTGKVVIGPSTNCTPDEIGSDADLNATCKPTTDPHQANNVGLEDQLAYYSNYGSRIDIAAPGGARKFGIPSADRGGTPGFPYTDTDLTNVFETFSTTSNWATQIPCFVFKEGSGFPQNQCYTSIQGTSMATPHVSAVLALIASARPDLRHNVDAMVSLLKSGARAANNLTTALSATDLTGGDIGGIYGVPCDGGYCHLGGPVISNQDAYGAGMLMASVIAK